MSIATLPPEVINLIAAGETIDSQAALVRELAENSLDAGASRIVISLFLDSWRVSVADNGRGMSLTDLQVCAKPHSTSKIKSTDDLCKITSLGFRGEALHSVAQLADLEILSRCQADGEGWRILYQGGDVVELEEAAIAPGTIVNVSNLFGNCPVRRLGLPSASVQLKAIQATIHLIALCHPQVTWQVKLDGRKLFNISAGSTPQKILPQILKGVKLNDLQFLSREIEDFSPSFSSLLKRGKTPPNSISIGGETNSFYSPLKVETMGLSPFMKATEEKSKLELVLGLPDRCHRRRTDWVKVAVNGRIVKLPELEQTIITAFSKTLPRDRYPICFLHLQVNPSQIDWNRHPAKNEIYLHCLKFWQEQVTTAIDNALHINPETLPSALQNGRVSKLIKKVADKSGVYHLNREISKTTNEIGLMKLRAVAQLRNTYIIAEHPAGIWLIEQHIAHERVLYEQFIADWKLVPLTTPIVLSQLKPSQIKQLERLELNIELFGEQLWAIRSAPEMLAQRPDCAAALIELSNGGDLKEAQVATACRSAIRNGMVLSLAEMQTLLNQWQNTRHPRTCPHGRPIFLSLEESALARFFRRNWVIGKSHGI